MTLERRFLATRRQREPGTEIHRTTETDTQKDRQSTALRDHLTSHETILGNFWSSPSLAVSASQQVINPSLHARVPSFTTSLCPALSVSVSVGISVSFSCGPPVCLSLPLCLSLSVRLPLSPFTFGLPFCRPVRLLVCGPVCL